MAEDIITIGIAYDTSKVLTGTRQVETELKKLEAAERGAQTQATNLERATTQTAGAMRQEAQAATQAASATQQAGQATQSAAQHATTMAAAEQKLAQALQQAAQALTQEVQKLHQTEQAAGAAGRQVGSMGGAMQDFGRQVGAFALAQAGVMGLQQTLSTIMQTMASVVRTGVQMAQLRGSFAAITGSVSAGNREFQFAVTTANRLGVGVQSLAEQYRSLSAATRGTALEGQATRQLFVALSNAAQAYGLSTEQLGRAMSALQQIISKGKVSQEELRQQLAEAIPGAVQIAARAFNTNTAALEDMIAKGVDATDFIKRFTAQLVVETPAATERAGRGFALLGNEILLLKDYIAQTGLLRWLDAAAEKLGLIAKGMRDMDAARQASTEAGAKPTLGPGVTLDKLQAEDRQKLLAVTEKLLKAEGELSGLKFAQKNQSFGLLTPLFSREGVIKEVEAEIAVLRQQQAEIAKAATARSQEAQRAGARQKEITEQHTDNQGKIRDTEAANKKLTASLDAQQKAQEALNKSAALTPELYGKQNGTLQEQIRFLEARKKITEATLKDVTETIVARPAGTGAVPKELEAQKSALQEQLRQDTAAIERNKQAIEDAEKAKRKALQDTEEAERQRKQAKEEEDRLDKQQAEEVRRTHFQNFEALKRLEAQYTSVRAVRDEDRASTLAASLATSQYADEAQRLAKRIEDVQRVEAKLPQLRSEAATSAQSLTEIQRLEQQLEPSRRQLTTRQRHAQTLAELERLTPADQREEVLGRARATSAETLAKEELRQLEDFAVSTFDHIGDAMTQLAMHGKFTFKDMVTSIAEDFYRLSLQTVTKMVTESKWFDTAMQAVGVALGIGGAVSGPTSGLLPTTEAQYTAMAAKGYFTGGPLPTRQGGGDVAAGNPYLVGEGGPELFVPRTSGTIVPHGSGGSSGPVVVNMTIHTPDAGSFTRSRGEVEATLYTAMQRAMRNA